MKVRKNGKVLIINDALSDRYLIDLGYEEVIDDEEPQGKSEIEKKDEAEENVIYDVPTFDNTD